MVTDPIANFIIALKNGSMARKPSVSVPSSKMKLEIAQLLEKKGFIGSVSKKGKKVKYLEIPLLYSNGQARISDVKRISKPSRRLYEKSKEIKPFKQGVGMKVLSTPKGILADIDAKKENLGGEILFSIW